MDQPFRINELRSGVPGRRGELPLCRWVMSCAQKSEWDRYDGKAWISVCGKHFGPRGPYVGLETAQLLEISTGHMTKEDAKHLENGVDGVIYYPLTYGGEGTLNMSVGWLVWAGNEDLHPIKGSTDEDVRVTEMSNAFCTILSFAHEVGIRWVKFDKDSPHYNQFEVFEW